MTYKTDPVLRRLIAQHHPAASAAGSFLPQAGLTGLTLKVSLAGQHWLARREAPSVVPFVNRRREQRILQRLAPAGLGPRVYGYTAPWLLLEWLDGETLSAAALTARLPELVALIGQLHHQPLSGYRLHLLPLLETYWQLCRQRSVGWLRALRTLRRQGEPRPLRLAPLHMDIHAGNVVDNQHRLQLIDWEYAADGDIALELMALCLSNALTDAQCTAVVHQYARDNQLAVEALRRQMTRWRPWLRVLIASWYQLRAEQSGDMTMISYAAEAWRRVDLRD
ncbi:Thiamine kinase [Paramixta manurensis]|uniref:Thiamine kinase n=1 Tax=Paramixta manurensis TaxID=2740817 RepID=A0A6M8UE75_9GAMM|nr:Thiamine kinase [Erwiniaceae bacterium PD-1]